MLKQILNYQKIIFSSTYSTHGSMKDWRKGIPDSLSLLPLILVPCVFVLWWNIPYGILLSVSVTLLPLSFINDGRLGRNSFFEYLPVSKEFKVLNMFVLLFFIVLSYFLLMLYCFALVVFLSEISLSVLLSTYQANLAVVAQPVQETLLLFSMTLIICSLMMMTYFFKRLVARYGVRIMLTFAVFVGWYLLLKEFSRGFMLLDIGWKNNFYALGLAVFVFAFCLFLTRALVKRDKKHTALSARS